ncbi:Pyruvate decarboxylase 3 [Aspergillus alliaceus]|uniref:Pyruvate decarboxylase 3 n=1 Tax=Petromyces alliaceus TaxID=209559 RepID=A0A8H6A2P7_PETAA|nr:Pyruvate decarboxylase 3 [Aspergillus burnettii]
MAPSFSTVECVPAIRQVPSPNEYTFRILIILGGLQLDITRSGTQEQIPSSGRCFCHLHGAGGLSVLNAIAGAYSENIRVIVISDSPLQETFSQDRLVHRTLGIKKQRSTLPDFQGSTTAAVRLTTDNDPIGTLDSTISRCLEDSSPVYIEISSSISQTPCEPPKPPIVNKPLPQRPDHINTVADAIGRTASPDVLVASIDKLGYAVFVQPDSKPLVPEGHPQFAGTFWSSAKSRRILDLQDRYITSPYGETIQGISLNDIVRALIASNIPHNDTTSRALPLALGLRTEALTVVPTFEGIEDILKPNDTLFAKTGNSWFNANTIQLPNGTNFHMQMIYASIKWGLPATLICQVGRPDGRVITMIGDGSFRMPRRK